jgi:hypothetical protein
MNDYATLADLRPDDEELLVLLDVLDEVNGVPPAGPGAGDEDDGPWHDEADLAAQYEHVTALAGGAAIRDQIRLEEDAADELAGRQGSYDRMARALDRAARGTYTPPAMYRDRSPGGCNGGSRDDYGRCASRYHLSNCAEVSRASAATSDAEAVTAWNQALLSGAASNGALLANGIEPTWDDLLSGEPGVTSAEALEYMRAQLGIRTGPAPARPVPGHLAQEMGLL